MADAVDGRRGWAGFAAATLAALLLYSAVNTPAAIYPVFEQIYGLRPFTVTTIYGAYSVALIPTLLITASAANVVGFRVILSAAWAVGAVGLLVMAGADGLVLLHLGRFLQGIAMGLATGGTAAALVALERRRDPRRASVAMTAAISFGSGLGPIVAGAFAQYLTVPDRLSFIVFGTLLALCAVGFWLRMPPALGRTGIRWAPRLPAIPGDSRTPFLLTCSNAFLTWAVAGIFLGLAPSYFRAAAPDTSLVVAAVPTGLTMICAGLAQLSLSRYSLRYAQLVGLIVTCAGFGMLVTGGELGSSALIIASAAVAGSGLGTAFLGGADSVNQMSSERADAAGVFATFAMSCYTGSGLLIIGVGLLGNLLGTTTAVLAFAVTIGVLGAVWIAVSRGRIVPDLPDAVASAALEPSAAPGRKGLHDER